jgi:hypothetical protein
VAVTRAVVPPRCAEELLLSWIAFSLEGRGCARSRQPPRRSRRGGGDERRRCSSRRALLGTSGTCRALGSAGRPAPPSPEQRSGARCGPRRGWRRRQINSPAGAAAPVPTIMITAIVGTCNSSIAVVAGRGARRRCGPRQWQRGLGRTPSRLIVAAAALRAQERCTAGAGQRSARPAGEPAGALRSVAASSAGRSPRR